METTSISYDQLLQFANDVFLKMGCPLSDAQTAAKVLLSADLRGIDSHGVARLAGYVRLWEAGRVNPTPDVKVVYETLSTAVIDGDAGLGLVVAPFSMNIAMKKAEAAGTGWVSVRNSNHFGIAGVHAMMALKKDMIGLAMTNASALVAPTFSSERLLGTNPIAVAIPAGEESPFVADMATTTASNGKLEILQRLEKSAPRGWVQDAAGAPSTDAAILRKKGALLPLGGDQLHGSHKGYAFGSIVDIFSAVLSGAAYGPWVPPFPAYVPMPEDPPGKGLGHFFGAMRIDAFQPATDYKKQMDHWLRRFRAATPIPGKDQVLVPGDPERAMEKQRQKSGIPLLKSVRTDLAAVAVKLNLDSDFLQL